jgi:fructose-bisphosphate aldolase class I
MNTPELKKTISQLTEGDKGLLAMDESRATCNKRFKKLGIPQTKEYRRMYRELIVTTPNLSDYIGGAILFDETIRQRSADGRFLVDILISNNIIPGIKVDEGTVALAGFPSEKITEGLDGLRKRLGSYYALGARFAKWRAVISIGEHTPTAGSVYANCHLLARYAALCQEAGLVPIVEPEVLMNGKHSIETCAVVTRMALNTLFDELYKQRVDLEAIILKPNMVLPGLDDEIQPDAGTVADATVLCLLETVPASVPAITFLSGGQSAKQATERLNAMHVRYRHSIPWKLTYSYSRALQQPALEMWNGLAENVIHAQQLLLARVAFNSAANRGAYDDLLEGDVSLTQ